MLTKKSYKKNVLAFSRCPLPPSMQFKLVSRKRLELIQQEFEKGFNFLYPLKNEVTFFGSARLDEKNKYCKIARKLAQRLAKQGYTIITGGGSGIMEAANRGAVDAEGESVGINIQLPTEQRINPYVKKSLAFHYFFIRKVIMSASAQAYVFFPGGFGTLDEFFELVMLIQTRKMARVPIILIGQKFWKPLLNFIDEVVLKETKTISPTDSSIYILAKSIDHAYNLVLASRERTYF